MENTTALNSSSDDLGQEPDDFNTADTIASLTDIDMIIEASRGALALHQWPHPERASSLNNLANGLHSRFDEEGDLKDLDEAIKLYREARALPRLPHTNQEIYVNELANAVESRFDERVAEEDLDEAIQLYREALVLYPAPHPDRDNYLDNLANVLETRLKQRGGSEDLDELIGLYREVLALHLHPDPKRAASLNNLAIAVHKRFQHQGDSKDLDEVFQLHTEALTLRAASHPDRAQSLHGLANVLGAWFQQRGDPKDLEDAIELRRKALDLCPPPHEDRDLYLLTLAITLHIRFEQWSDSRDLNEVIDLHKEALGLRAPPHPHRCSSLNALATAVRARFQQQGDSKDLHLAIELHREALALRARHPDRDIYLSNLGSALRTRFSEGGDPMDLEEGIRLDREALALRTPPHPISLHNLANALQVKFTHSGHSKDLDEAIELHREALDRCAHPYRGGHLNNLAGAIGTRFEHKGDPKDLNEVIELNAKALALHPAPHLHRGDSLENLGLSLEIRFTQRGNPQDLDKAVELYREALALRPPPHPDRGHSLKTLGSGLSTTCTHTNNTYVVDEIFAVLHEAATYSSSSPLTRFHHAVFWATTAVKHGHTSSITAYHAAIELLPQLAALHLDFPSRRQILSTAHDTRLASNAATCAVGLGRYNIAVEFLEASRSVFWSQALHLRTPLDDLATVRPDLSAELTDLSSKLEQASFRDTSRNPLTDTQQKRISIESEGERCRKLNEDWAQIIKDTRKLPGFGDFMRPKNINALKQAAVAGPILILVPSNSDSFALIVTYTHEVQFLKLPDLTLPFADLLAALSCALSDRAFDFDTFRATRGQERYNPRDLATLDARLFGGREGSIKRSSDDVFRGILADLWENMVKPVLDALGLKKSIDPPRLWWCPTGSFAFLPIHAAGIYNNDMTDYTSDYVISSYTPTLTALLDPPTHIAAVSKIAAVIQPTTTNCSPLPGARAELRKIETRVPNQWLTALVNATVETALIHLHESSIVHFACHGIQDKRPLDSGLILTDGRLKISEVMRRPEGDNILDVKKFMSLAFLSACETAKGDNIVPDESMHLAATLLFSGFRGVVATMWTMHDLDGPTIADSFYEHLFKNCDPNSNPPVLPDLTQAAKALHVAVANLRKEPDISFRRWVPFVHYGL
ncbi:CHAT domain-containing protein [Mycena galopus ATCC 62051]|nr:CHAT domain-containing protein [Mycena galopus ATCC 62051]